MIFSVEFWTEARAMPVKTLVDSLPLAKTNGESVGQMGTVLEQF